MARADERVPRGSGDLEFKIRVLGCLLRVRMRPNTYARPEAGRNYSGECSGCHAPGLCVGRFHMLLMLVHLRPQ
eukprot:6037765-Alexandrium_andersonii.AAC.1